MIHIPKLLVLFCSEVQLLSSPASPELLTRRAHLLVKTVPCLYPLTEGVDSGMRSNTSFL